MTLSDLADVGELIGGVSVVASLVYLALQIRQNTRAVRASTLHSNTDVWADLFLRLADPTLSQAYYVGMTGSPEVKPLHYTQFFFLCKSMFLALENQYYQARAGVLDPGIYASYERAAAEQLLAFRGFRIWWDQTRATFSPAFIERIEGLIEDQAETPPDAFLRTWRELAERRAGEPTPAASAS